MLDITGERYGRLVAVERVGMKNHRQVWRCICDCGKEHFATIDCLRAGHTKSCGCLNDEMRGKKGLESNRAKHGGAGTRLYREWKAMRSRCKCKNTESYQKWYGAKGITVCPEWDDFAVFRDWALANGYSDELSIDRIDPDKGYSPDNCRWADRYQQANNRTSNHYVEINGEKKTVAEWCRYAGISKSYWYKRYNQGLRGEDLLAPPPVRRKKRGD